MLRTLLVLIIIAIGIRFSFKQPFYALLFYLWNAYFRPEQWVWHSFITSLNLSFTVGSYLLVSTAFSGERFRFGREAAIPIAILVHSLVSTLVGVDVQYSFPFWVEFMKVIVICYMMTILVTTPERLRATLFVIGLSLAFEGAKQGWTQLLLHPGARNDNGSPMLGDNNGVAVGMLMLVPILVALGRTTTWWPEKWGSRFFMVGVAYRAMSTYSRGGFLSAGALGLHYLMFAKHKVRAALSIVIVAGVIISALPDSFWERMGTIPAPGAEASEMDGSAAGRIYFWQVAVQMANDRPIFGIGHNGYNNVYDRYDETNGAFGRGRSVHSAWFGALAELGYPGLLMFVGALALAFYSCFSVRRQAKKRPELAHLALFATAIEAALVVFVVGGTFLPFQYNEMVWHMITLGMITSRIAASGVRQKSESPSAPAAIPERVVVSTTPRIPVALRRSGTGNGH